MRVKRLAGMAMAGAGALAMALPIVGERVGADGTETLGPPSIAIADGSGVVMAGVGLEDAQPGVINISVPAGASVEQVLLYWEGQNTMSGGDDTAVVNGTTEVTGTLIGGVTRFFSGAYSSTYRADITSLGVVSAGANAVSVGGLDFTRVANGAGLIVIYDDGTTTDIQIRDGNDLAFYDFAPPLDTTVLQTFTFPAASVPREATLGAFFSSVTGPASGGGPIRPSIIRVEVGGVVTDAIDLLDSNDGNEWDTDQVTVTIPAGATSLTIQALSEDASGVNTPEPASFAWNAASLALPDAPPPPTDPPVTEPPPTDPPVTDPPVTEPPVTEPPGTDPAPPPTGVLPESSVVPPPTPPPGGQLPATGPDQSSAALYGGLALLIAGIGLIVAARRSRPLARVSSDKS